VCCGYSRKGGAAEPMAIWTTDEESVDARPPRCPDVHVAGAGLVWNASIAARPWEPPSDAERAVAVGAIKFRVPAARQSRWA
jgi:hypothetical protein